MAPRREVVLAVVGVILAITWQLYKDQAIDLLFKPFPDAFNPLWKEYSWVLTGLLALLPLIPLFRSSSSPRSDEASQFWIEFITDVEGNWEYFNALVEASEILSWNEHGQLELKEGAYLYVGGDVVDKGTGDIRVTKSLLDLKSRRNEDVIFILGNRDVNKLRFISELEPGQSGEMVDVYWDAKHTKYVDFIAKKNLDPKDVRMNTLKWMLDCTMGCQTTFQTRRMELAEISRRSVEAVAEREVFDSFYNSVNSKGEDPWMLNFIRAGCLADMVGDVLFVHGSISPQTIGVVPGSEVKYATVKKWIKALNAWGRAQVHDFLDSPKWNEKHERGGSGLMDYGLPGGNGNRTIVTSNWLKNGNCADLDPSVENWLLKGGVKRVFTGHQPHGECPSVICTPKGLQIFMCDTSYSKMDADKSKNPANNRGDAYSVVRIYSHATEVYGKLTNGREHRYMINVQGKEAPKTVELQDSLVGRKLKDEWWVKTVLEGTERKLIVAKGEGYKVDTKEMDATQVLEQLDDNYRTGLEWFDKNN